MTGCQVSGLRLAENVGRSIGQARLLTFQGLVDVVVLVQEANEGIFFGLCRLDGGVSLAVRSTYGILHEAVLNEAGGEDSGEKVSRG